MNKFMWTPPTGSWRLKAGDPTAFEAWRIVPGVLVVKNIFLTRNKYKVTHEASGLAIVSEGFRSLKAAADAARVAASGFDFNRSKDEVLAATFKEGRQVAPQSVVDAHKLKRPLRIALSCRL